MPFGLRLSGEIIMSCTLRDVAHLAGVSTATVSRVVNGSQRVSCNAKSNVLSAISRLQYHPDIHAVELRRGKGKNRRERGVHMFASSVAKTEPYSDRRAEAQREWRKAERLRLLEEENARLKRLVTNLSMDLETWRRIAP
jgi:transcriptional regulator with XRE-family HTH domain